MTTYVFFISSNTGWNPGSVGLTAGNTISPEALGPGGGGGGPGGIGGGGGAWAKPAGTTYTLVSGDLSAPFMSITMGVGGTGGDSVNAPTAGTADTIWKNAAGTTLCDAGPGSADLNYSLGTGLGGTVVIGTGFSGGNAGLAHFTGGSGAGGSAGPAGAGSNGGDSVATIGNGGGEGGGAEGQGLGNNGGATAGGTGGSVTGGDGGLGVAAGTSNSGAGVAGGSIGTEWDGTHGPGGGGGGGGGNLGTGNGGNGGLGGSYGGGGGGSGDDNVTRPSIGGNGGPALGIVGYTISAATIMRRFDSNTNRRGSRAMMAA